VIDEEWRGGEGEIAIRPSIGRVIRP